MIVVNNVFVGHEVAIKRLRINSVAAHNIFHANTVNLLDAISDQTTNLYANPQLRTDGSLLPASPAIDMGATPLQFEFIPEKDIDGVTRPQGAGYDMGAYEKE